MTHRSADIFVTWSFEGFHRWPDAPPERAYLATLHRHLFQCQASVTVEHDDREVEFHDLLDVCRTVSTIEGEHESCEMIANRVHAAIDARYPGRSVTVSVSEDGECGAVVTWQA